MPSIIDRILKISDNRAVKRLRGITDAVNVLEDEFRAMTDAQVREETDRFTERLADGETLDQILPEAFAAVREAAGRTLGQRHYDVQLMGGVALHQGNIAEMKTGEGKTLVATAPAYLNALTGKGVHIVTVNDFLASYQADLMGRVFRFLGMETGCIVSGQDPATRRRQYQADITYGTNNEFGFDFLRDNMAWSLDELVQREHHFAIVDEVDSILIDEARTPLIISGPAQGDANRWYGEFARMVRRLERDTDYEVDEKKKTVGVLEPGIEKVEDHLGIQNLYEAQNTTLIQFLNNAVKAKELFKRDKDYVVLDGEVQIVDEHTGRVLPGRRYNEGMHQAIEAKEGVQIKAENQTLATVTLQNYFRLYEKLSGMTGTAETEAAEFANTYKLGVVVIPPNKEKRRVDKNDLVYKNEKVKFDAVVEDIAERHATGQPVLVGTTSVEKSEYLSKLLAKKGIRHEVLNAKNHAREAAIVAQAGRLGAVTVATNMAGRGTDIMLGGNAEFSAVARMQELGLDPETDSEAYEEKWPQVLEDAQRAVKEEHDKVIEAGGLYVLGTERHDSRRIDNQLRGRSGRQGDPGESRFYLSLTDELMRNFNPGAAQRIMNSAAIPDDMALEFKMVSSAIQNAQAQVEGRNAEQRKNVLKYDDVMNRQREAIYADRRSILEGEDLRDKVRNFVEDAVGAMVDAATEEGTAAEWDLDQLWTDLRTLYPVGITHEEVVEEAGGLSRLKAATLKRELASDALLAYEDREAQVGDEALREAERRVVLSVIGKKWQEHLYEMDYLKEGIGLRAMAQREPLVEYQREGYLLYQAMMAGIREDSVRTLFSADISAAPKPVSLPGVADARGATMLPQVNVEGLESPRRPAQLRMSGPGEDGSTVVRRDRGDGVGQGSGETDATTQYSSRRERRRAEQAAKKKGR
ncbi:Protein export cytoplasm protein SecA ATPase RNA helicase (TC 3.A.5.1.1) [Micrococcus lylae]|uniref:Protein translocase subunit SecA n=1 Tax=Micrococcus lylae TaxID=1273 RepID=A0A1R4I633_9MICC|nr:preprotein translocase subunit SecA [Micrococcus lylae]WIK83170.1 preprotein translocase subunit SecA [Micrococcus lylae]SJN15307.1 Protein export cytoplasm protein SecA ATPase RNA helicase (TC 3.A.5.1.1) [Micrococcus lylae]